MDRLVHNHQLGKMSFVSLSLIVLGTLLVESIAHHANASAGLRVGDLFRQEADDDIVRVFIGYNSSSALTLVKRSATARTEINFPEINAVAVEISKKDLLELEQEYDILYVEKDEIMYPMAQIVPYGIKLTKANVDLPSPTFATAGDCNSAQSFKIAIIDTGIYGGHPDLSCSGRSDQSCIGRSFGTSSLWYRDTVGHGKSLSEFFWSYATDLNRATMIPGTHVSGTIGALGKNDKGVVGMVPDSKVCYIIGRVFGDSGQGSASSSIMQAVAWAVEQGAKVINMSLGGGGYSVSADEFYRKIFAEKGRIVVASSGNNGSSQKSYPASYRRVVSVAAVDSNSQRASFSQYNDAVDFTAPGVDVLSTVPPGRGQVAWLDISSVSKTFQVDTLNYSPMTPTGGKSGSIVLCPQLGKSTCPGPGGHICLIQRGDITFEEKALNCQAGNGAAALIYNNADGSFSGTLDSNTRVTIPVLAISGQDGSKILDQFKGQKATITSVDGFAYYSGTSMSAPHVTGAIAAIWRTCRQCKNRDIIQCLKRTTKDLGVSGKDNVYGHGLIQTKPAYECLQARCCQKN